MKQLNVYAYSVTRHSDSPYDHQAVNFYVISDTPEQASLDVQEELGEDLKTLSGPVTQIQDAYFTGNESPAPPDGGDGSESGPGGGAGPGARKALTGPLAPRPVHPDQSLPEGSGRPSAGHDLPETGRPARPDQGLPEPGKPGRPDQSLPETPGKPEHKPVGKPEPKR